MKRFFTRSVALMWFAWGMGWALAAEQKVPTVAFEMTQTLKREQAAPQAGPLAGNGMVIQSKGWVKGNKMRMDMTMQNLGLQMTTLVLDGWVYTVMTPELGFKMKLPAEIPQQKEALSALSDPAARAQFMAKMKAQKVGTETINGIVCDIYDFTGTLQSMGLHFGGLSGGMPGPPGAGEPGKNPMQGAKGKLWLDQKTGHPVKVVTQMPAMKMTATVEYRKFQTGVEIPEEKFVLPQGVQFQDLSALLQNMIPKPPQ